MKYFKLLEADYSANIDDFIDYLEASKELNGMGLAGLKDILATSTVISESKLKTKGAIFDFDEMTKMAEDLLSKPSLNKHDRQLLKRLGAGINYVFQMWNKNKLHNLDLSQKLQSEVVKLLVAKWFDQGVNQTNSSDCFLNKLAERSDLYVKKCVADGLYHDFGKSHLDKIKSNIADELKAIWTKMPEENAPLVTLLEERRQVQAVSCIKTGYKSLCDLVLPALKEQVIKRLKDRSLFAYHELTERLRSIADSFEKQDEIEFDKKVLFKKAIDEVFLHWQRGVYHETPLEGQLEAIITEVVKPIKLEKGEEIDMLRAASIESVLLDVKHNTVIDEKATQILKRIIDSKISLYYENMIRNASPENAIITSIVSQLLLDIRNGKVEIEGNNFFDTFNKELHQLCQRIVTVVDTHRKMSEIQETIEGALIRISALENELKSLKNVSMQLPTDSDDAVKNSGVGKPTFFTK